MPVLNSTMAEEVTLEKRLANATILRTFDTKGAYIRHFDVANNVVAFTLLKNDSVFVTVCDIDGKELSHFGQAVDSNGRIEGAELSPDGKILIIHKYHGRVAHHFMVGLQPLHFKCDSYPAPRRLFFLTNPPLWRPSAAPNRLSAGG
jgi:hypothetical protein